jgi:hypothetical protein
MGMRIAFHQICPLAKRALLELQQTRPELIPAALVAERHYTDFALLHAAACFLLYDDLDLCLVRIARDRGIEDYIAQNTLTLAIANAPAIWQADSEYFYAKGLLNVGERYYIVPKDLQRHTAFDTARRKLSGPAKKILDHGIDSILGGKLRNHKSAHNLLLSYLAAQLMMEGCEKKFRLSALSVSGGVHSSHHKNYTAQAMPLIYRFAKEANVDWRSLNIVLQEGILGVPKMHKQKTPKSAHVRNFLASNDPQKSDIRKSATQ